jgi:hypothetical protein
MLKLLLRQFSCASVGKQTNFDSIKMHGMCVKSNWTYLTISRHVQIPENGGEAMSPKLGVVVYIDASDGPRRFYYINRVFFYRRTVASRADDIVAA